MMSRTDYTHVRIENGEMNVYCCDNDGPEDLREVEILFAAGQGPNGFAVLSIVGEGGIKAALKVPVVNIDGFKCGFSITRIDVSGIPFCHPVMAS
ncbi:hypothetical protein [Aureimonas altamirensis]|uniref:hypothetical protein n=1 Tax=Aureimonas altamirensis TaxID=370622 RepID=UPI0025521363|nr:hypothetical protein [Aureimonas altamirensis]